MAVKDASIGLTTGAAVKTDAAGTLQQYLRGLIAIFADVWTDVANAFGVILRNGAGTEIGTAAAPLRTDPTGTTTQPVSGPLTDAQLRATAVPISGPLTDAQLRATAVQVDVADEAARQVGVVSLTGAVPAGTNNIGDVDVLSVPDRGQAVSPGNVATGDAFADVTGATVDTLVRGEKFIAFLLKEVGGVNGVTFRVQGSIDGTTYTNILGPIDSSGLEDIDGEFAVAANGSTEQFITPEYDNGAKAAYRHFKVQAKSTTAGNSGSAQVRVFAK